MLTVLGYTVPSERGHGNMNMRLLAHVVMGKVANRGAVHSTGLFFVPLHSVGITAHWTMLPIFKINYPFS